MGPSLQRVEDHMTRMPHAVDADSPLADALRRMQTLGIGHLPVLDEGEVVGILYERELGPIYETGDRDPTEPDAGG